MKKRVIGYVLLFLVLLLSLLNAKSAFAEDYITLKDISWQTGEAYIFTGNASALYVDSYNAKGKIIRTNRYKISEMKKVFVPDFQTIPNVSKAAVVLDLSCYASKGATLKIYTDKSITQDTGNKTIDLELFGQGKIVGVKIEPIKMQMGEEGPVYTGGNSQVKVKDRGKTYQFELDSEGISYATKNDEEDDWGDCEDWSGKKVYIGELSGVSDEFPLISKKVTLDKSRISNRQKAPKVILDWKHNTIKFPKNSQISVLQHGDGVEESLFDGYFFADSKWTNVGKGSEGWGEETWEKEVKLEKYGYNVDDVIKYANSYLTTTGTAIRPRSSKYAAVLAVRTFKNTKYGAEASKLAVVKIPWREELKKSQVLDEIEIYDTEDEDYDARYLKVINHSENIYQICTIGDYEIDLKGDPQGNKHKWKTVKPGKSIRIDNVWSWDGVIGYRILGERETKEKDLKWMTNPLYVYGEYE